MPVSKSQIRWTRFFLLLFAGCLAALAVGAAAQQQGLVSWIALLGGFGLGPLLASKYLIGAMRSTSPMTTRGVVVAALAAGSGPATGAIARALHAEDLFLLAVTFALGGVASGLVFTALDERAMAATTARRLRGPSP